MEGETKVLIVATIAWGLRKCSRAIMLALIFLIAIKPGFIHAVYSMFHQTLPWSFTLNRFYRSVEYNPLPLIILTHRIKLYFIMRQYHMLVY